MRFQVSELVVAPENQETAKRLIGITQVHDCPELLYLTGPANSGKSVFLEASGTEKDLLSTKKVMYCHASEILAMLSIGNENADNFLNRVGEVDVLLIDDVEDFLKNEAVGAQACKLLIESRGKQGLDTVVASRIPLLELDGHLRSVFSNFEEIIMAPLNEEGAAALAKSYANHFTRAKDKENVNTLADETFAYLGKKYCCSLKDMAPAIEYLVAVAELPKDKLVSPKEAENHLTL